VTLTDRDRKIAMFVVPIVVLAAYWFLLLSPKREESATLGTELTQAEADRDAALEQARQAEAARTSFSADYAAMVRLGKAIPSTVDMPSLLVQLDSAAAGTDITFRRISAGARVPIAAPAASSTSGSTPDGNAAPGGTPASTAPGQAAEQAGEAAQTADAANAEAGADAPESTGAAPAGGSLDGVPLQFTFDGSFFNLADFFHDLKRFVRLSGGDDVDVRGRLMTIDSLTLTPTDFPRMEAQVTATVYLSPKTGGVTAGATPQGPPPASSGSTPASSGGTSATTPAAVAAPR
jgi:hypothetical protein